MNYYIDTEFLEGTQKEKFPISLFRKNTLSTIDLISIGIVSEDNREYYAISKDFNLKEAWNRFDLKEYEKGDYLWKDGVENGEVEWVPSEKGKLTINNPKKIYWIRENVLKPIWRELFFDADDCLGLSNKQTEAYHKSVMSGGYDTYFTYKSLKFLIQKYGKSNKQIAEEICRFIYERYANGENDSHGYISPGETSIKEVKTTDVKFYAYYADYDWVAFCWLFGKMIDLPNGFPMYCYDLKQILDEKEIERQDGTDMVELRNLPTYPKQENEHNALDDARWNKKLHEFLNQL